MANVDFPRGFWPLRMISGGCDFTTNTYTVTTGAVIYRGDPVKVVAGGTVEVEAASDAGICIGIAAEYVSDSGSVGGKLIRIYDSSDIVFGVQSTTGVTTALTSAFDCADMITYGAGNNGVSIMELDTPSSSQAQFKVIGLVKDIQNSWGEHSDLEVIFNEHYFKTIGAGPS